MGRDRHLVYLVIGEGRHVPEAIYGIYTARWHERDRSGRTHVVVYTDRVRELPDELRIEQVIVDPQRLASWTRGSVYRAKTCALKDALDTRGAPCVYIDCDTYFRAPADALFARCAKGNSLLHIRELPMTSLGRGSWDAFVGVAYRDAAGRTGVIEADDMMWNAGVIGVPPANAHVLDDVLAAHDSLIEQGLPQISEQVALSQLLAKRTELRAADDVVFHYWGAFRERWQGTLALLLERAERLPVDERANYLYANRPRLTLRQELRHLVKIPLQRLGLVRPTEGSSHHTIPPALPRQQTFSDGRG